MRWKHSHGRARQIVCLACGETRIVLGIQTGECPACHYLGWTYADELDSSTRRMIINGAFAHPRRPVPPRGPASTAAR